MAEVLNETFLDELFKGCLTNKHFLDLCCSVVEDAFLPDKNYARVWKVIKKKYQSSQKLPTIGAIKVELWKEEEAKKVLDQIREQPVVDMDALMVTLEDFIRRAKTVQNYVKFSELYNGGKREDAYAFWVQSAEWLKEFSLQDFDYDQVFTGFLSRYNDRITNPHNRKRFPLGIDELDDALDGGSESSEIVLFLGESGVGKSICLVGAGIACARLGGKVAHIQLEGTRDQCMNRYDSAFLGAEYRDVKMAEVDAEVLKKARKAITEVQGEIFVKSFEKFYTCTTQDVRVFVQELNKIHGHIDRIIIDMLELCDPAPRNGVFFKASEERFRQSKVARECKEIAMEFNVDLITATYSNTIDINEKNDQDFVLTRWNLSEDKGKIRPFDVFVTINQTHDEYKDSKARLFTDKVREHKGNDLIRIAQNLGRTRFYDRKRTIQEFSEKESEDKND